MTDVPSALPSASAQVFHRCDFAVVASYLDFFGLPYTSRSLNDYLEHGFRASCMTEIADCLAQHGLEVTLVNSTPEFFSRTAWQKFLSPPGVAESEHTSSTLETERIMQKGVRINRSLISQELLNELLASGQPLIIGYDPALLHTIEASSFQQAIITKVTETEYELFEPLRLQQTSRFPKNILVAAILATHNSDPSSQSIIAGKERVFSPVNEDGEEKLQEI